MHFYAQTIKGFIMLIKKVTIFLLFFILFNFVLLADLYEGFDFPYKSGLSLEDSRVNSGKSSKGWMSTWQLGLGDAISSKKDISFDDLISNEGSLLLRGERKSNTFFGKGFAVRQSSNAYVGTVYGSFRIIPGFITQETVIGLIFSLPNFNEMSVRNGLFAICPKRWGGELGMIGAKGKTFKNVEGVPCVKGEKYLILWTMSELPALGSSADVTLKYLVLNQKQVRFFASNNL